MKQTLKIGQKYRVINSVDLPHLVGRIITVKKKFGKDQFFDENNYLWDIKLDTLQLIKPKTKKVKKCNHKFINCFDDIGKVTEFCYKCGKQNPNCGVRWDIPRLATQPQPKDYIEETTKYSKKDFDYLSKSLKATRQEDNKDYRYVYCCPVDGEYYKVCPKCNPTPSPLDEHKWLYELKDWKDFTLDELEFEIVSIIRYWKKEQNDNHTR